MHEGLYIAASAGIKQQRKLEILGNNLANINTNGYKRDGLVFQEMIPPFEEDTNFDSSRNFLQPPANSNANVSYVGVTNLYTEHAQGPIRSTGNEFDLSLDGPGFFEIRTPQGLRYTRNGNFRLDTQNRLVTQEGHIVLGEGEAPVVIDTQATGQANAQGTQVTIDLNGAISLGTGINNIPAGQMVLVNFQDHTQLEKVGGSLYRLKNPDALRENPAGTRIIQGSLESSNVSPVEEMTEMIFTHRAFESYQKIIQAIDQADDDAVNSIGRVA